MGKKKVSACHALNGEAGAAEGGRIMESLFYGCVCLLVISAVVLAVTFAVYMIHEMRKK